VNPWDLLKKYGIRRQSLIAHFATLVVLESNIVLIGIILPLFSKILFDYVFLKEDAQLLKFVCITFALFYIFHFIMQSCAEILRCFITQKIGFSLRKQIYGKIQRLQLHMHSSKSKGDVIVRLTDDIDRAQDGILNQKVDLITQTIQILGILVFCFWINSEVSIFIASSLPVYLTLSRYIFKRELGVVRDKLVQQKSNIIDYLQVKLRHIFLIKSFHQEHHEEVNYEHYLRDQISLTFQDKFLKTLFSLNSNLGFDLWNVFVVWILGKRVIDEQITVGDVISLFLLFSQVRSPAVGLTQQFGRFRTCVASLKRIEDILTISSEESLFSTQQMSKIQDGDIVLTHVCFGYNTHEPIFKGLSLRIEPRSYVVLSGQNGSGRSSLWQMILRYYSPSEGQITIDGQPLNSFSLESLRRSIIHITQGHDLFPGTLRENITYAQEDATEEEIVLALKKSEIFEFIQTLPKGLDTLIDRESKFSISERLRMVIARALLINPKVLILDEVTSGLDLMGDYLLQNAIQKMVNERTVVVITNKQSYLRNADKVIFIKDGKVAEEGTFQELIERKTDYYRYHLIQNSGFDVFKQMLDYELERYRRYQSEFSVVAYSIENFDEVKSQISSQYVPILSAEVNLAWIQAARRGDQVAMVADGHYLVLLPEVNEQKITWFLTRMRKLMEGRVFDIEKHQLKLRFSEKYITFSERSEWALNSEEIIHTVLDEIDSNFTQKKNKQPNVA
jgi:ABC-type multidrug transport system fused ATPase/permease subunit